MNVLTSPPGYLFSDPSDCLHTVYQKFFPQDQVERLMKKAEAESKKSKVLALDLSTKTGWAFFEDGKLVKHGLIRLSKKIEEYGNYPWSFVYATIELIEKIHNELIIPLFPNTIVVEETNSSKARYTQKILEFLHFRLLSSCVNISPSYCPIKYINSSEWRKVLGLTMSKEQKKNNAKLNKAKKQAEGTGTKLDKASLGIKGKITKKHLSVAYANSTYGLNLKIKDNDIADAICLGTAYLNGANICDGK